MSDQVPARPVRRKIGSYNSSVTRVWPVFEALFRRDMSGESWLGTLLAMAEGGCGQAAAPAPGRLAEKVVRRARAVPGNVCAAIGAERAVAISPLRNCFEWPVDPPARFLKWMIEHPYPHGAVWPLVKGVRRQCRCPIKQRWRERWYEGEADARNEGLNSLAKVGPAQSKGAWWAFEGRTSVDCYLETDSMVLLIEGKRTERISPATDWFPKRNQLARNLEVAAEIADASGKEFGVILCAEVPPLLTIDEIRCGLPHLDQPEQDRLMGRYFGCVTWAEIVSNLNLCIELPHDVGAALELCETGAANVSFPVADNSG